MEETWWQAASNPGWRLAVIAPTQSDLRKVLFEGQSGLQACCPPEVLAGGNWDEAYHTGMAQLRFANGSLITGYSAEQPGRLRGPQHHFAACDELAAWDVNRQVETWDMLSFGLRLGTDPRCLVTTTPRPFPLIYDLVKDPATKVIRGSTYDNADNLAPAFLKNITKYEGTELGRQEIHAELMDLDSRTILKKGFWRPWTEHAPEGVALYPGRPLLAFASIDAAYTAKEEGDYTAVTVWYVYVDQYGRTRILLRYGWQEKLEFPELIDRLKATIANFKLTRLLIEAKGPGLSIIQEIRRHRPEVVVHAWVPRGDKIARAHAVTPMLAQGLVYGATKMVDGEVRFIDPVQLVIDECARFPFAHNDDFADSVSQALEFVSRHGLELYESDRPAPPPLTAGSPGSSALY